MGKYFLCLQDLPTFVAKLVTRSQDILVPLPERHLISRALHLYCHESVYHVYNGVPKFRMCPDYAVSAAEAIILDDLYKDLMAAYLLTADSLPLDKEFNIYFRVDEVIHDMRRYPPQIIQDVPISLLMLGAKWGPTRMADVMAAGNPAYNYRVSEKERVDGEEIFDDVLRWLICVDDPGPFDRRWVEANDWTVGRLASAIYHERRFKDLPILADALEDASCQVPFILHHCRANRIHVKGCWVLERIRQVRRF